MLLVLALLLPLYSIADDVDCEKYENMKWTTDDRRGILKVHNEMRKKIREGNYVAGPKGQDKKHAAVSGTMLDLTYNCTTEMAIQKWAATCKGSHLPNAPGIGQNNWAIGPKTVPIFAGMGERASRSWESQFTENRWRCNAYAGGVHHKIAHPVQMAWANTTSIGCGVSHCGSNIMVVCGYYPRGCNVGELIYKDVDEFPPEQSSSASSSQLPLLCLLAVAALSDLFSDRMAPLFIL